MAGDNAKRRAAYFCFAAVHVKILRAVGNILAPEQFGRAFGDEFVARAVETKSADTSVVPRGGHGVASHGGRRELMKGGFEKPEQRRIRHPLGEQFDANDVRRIMRGS